MTGPRRGVASLTAAAAAAGSPLAHIEGDANDTSHEGDGSAIAAGSDGDSDATPAGPSATPDGLASQPLLTAFVWATASRGLVAGAARLLLGLRSAGPTAATDAAAEEPLCRVLHCLSAAAATPVVATTLAAALRTSPTKPPPAADGLAPAAALGPSATPVSVVLQLLAGAEAATRLHRSDAAAAALQWRRAAGDPFDAAAVAVAETEDGGDLADLLVALSREAPTQSGGPHDVVT